MTGADVATLCVGTALLVWLWRRASRMQLNVFSHGTLWLLAIAAAVLAVCAGDTGHWTAGRKVCFGEMDGLQASVLIAMVVIPLWLVVRALRRGGNAFSSAGVKSIALGLMAWIAVGYLTAPLYYGCNPLNPMCSDFYRSLF